MKPHGIVFVGYGRGLPMGYGWKHGFGCGWLPDFVQRLIVRAWNRANCAIVGHTPLDIPAEEGFARHYVRCVNCGG
jgi:hypothetical protein